MDTKNIALIIAGGVGSRMNNAIPKQFLTVNDKPIIAYTLEKFQKHPSIDVIAVVCLKGWEAILQSYATQYQVTKLKHVVSSGESGQESIKNGITELGKFYAGDSFVLVHDAIRPNVSSDIISSCLSTARQYGNSISCIPCNEAMLVTDDCGVSADKSFNREVLKRTQTPQAFHLSELSDLHKQAEERGIRNSVASCTLMVELGRKVYFSLGSELNLKITTQDDLDIFKALLQSKACI